METEEHLAEYLAKRGISPELAAARGYTPWQDTTGADIIAEAFEGIHQSAIDWLSGIASNEQDNGVGFTIPRRPIPGMGVPDERIFPEIKTEFAVKNGTKRHYHGGLGEFGVYAFLPTVVIDAMCIPTMGQYAPLFHTLYFMHNHEGMSEEELSVHERTFHGASRKPAIHRHSLRIFKPEDMSDHIKNEGGKFDNAHVGVNTDEIHKHVELAKYILPPHPPAPGSGWNREHDHSGMDEDELAWHLEHKHKQ